MAEDVMVIEQHRLNGHKFEQTPGDSGEEKSLCAAVHGVIMSQILLSN